MKFLAVQFRFYVFAEHYLVVFFLSTLPHTFNHTSETTAHCPHCSATTSPHSASNTASGSLSGNNEKYKKNKKQYFHLLIILGLNMQFKEDQISDFIRYKLNNPLALQEEMRLIEDRKQCIRKLEQYSKQMDCLKNQLANQHATLETLTARRIYIQQNYSQQKQQLQQQVVALKEKIDVTKRQIKQKQASNEMFIKKYEDSQRQFTVKRQRIIEQHQEQLFNLDEETEMLKQQKQEKALKQQQLIQKLKKLKDRQKIIFNTVQNVQAVRNKWNTKNMQLTALKQEQERREKEISQLVNYSNSMEKVIYGNLYKRCGLLVNELKLNLDALYNTEVAVGNAEFNWEEQAEKILNQLKTGRQNLLKIIKQKREKYKTSGNLPEPNPDEYNLIVQTKINPQMLILIDPKEYNINEQMYRLIEEGQNSILDSLQAQRVSKLEREKAKRRQNQTLQKKNGQFKQQIQIKRKSVLPPPKRKK